MTRSKYMAMAAAVGALGMGAVARAAEPTTEELMKQIEQLQAKVEQLETRQQALNSKDVDATVESVLRDADRRSQLLQMEGFTAGWQKGKGFMIQDAQGNWVLNPYFQFQFRSTTTYRDNAANDDDDDIQNGFEVRRMKVGFRGNAFTPDLTYNFRLETDQDGGSVTLEDANIQYFFSDDMAFKVGQWKDNVYHEETMSSGKQLAADRSMVNELLGGGLTDYVQGVALVYAPKDSTVRAEVAFHDGLNTDNTSFLEHTGGAFDLDPNWGVSARVDVKVMGDWKSYDDFSAMGNKEDLLVIGGGFDYTEDGAFNAIFHTVDVQWENAAGLGVYAAYLGIASDFDDADNFYDWGLIVQAGYMINDRWEVFGRYGYMDLDALASFDDTYHEATLGANYYVGGGHNAKVTVDVTWLCNGAPDDIEGIGVLAAENTEIIVRGQFQLLL